MPLSIGLIGYGHFGAFLHALAQRYLPDAALKIHSGRRKPDGVLFFPLEEVAACDAVVLAVPIGAYAATLEKIGPHMKPDGIVVDIATVKKYTMELLQTARPERPFIAMHPMFGPESYAKRGWRRHRIADRRHRAQPDALALFGTVREAHGGGVLDHRKDRRGARQGPWPRHSSSPTTSARLLHVADSSEPISTRCRSVF